MLLPSALAAVASVAPASMKGSRKMFVDLVLCQTCCKRTRRGISKEARKKAKKGERNVGPIPTASVNRTFVCITRQAKSVALTCAESILVTLPLL